MMPPNRNPSGFEEIHIALVWAELHDRFGFHVAGWKKKYFEEWNQHRAQDEAGFFLVYMNRHVNPLLNKILCRHDLHPTFTKLVDYVVNRPKKTSPREHPGRKGA